MYVAFELKIFICSDWYGIGVLHYKTSLHYYEVFNIISSLLFTWQSRLLRVMIKGQGSK